TKSKLKTISFEKAQINWSELFSVLIMYFWKISCPKNVKIRDVASRIIFIIVENWKKMTIGRIARLKKWRVKYLLFSIVF
ncbi:TPA: hypothetical protein ACGOYQ_000776, partial [Streptococcus suis]